MVEEEVVEVVEEETLLDAVDSAGVTLGADPAALVVVVAVAIAVARVLLADWCHS